MLCRSAIALDICQKADTPSLPQENADRIARRMWRPRSARAAAADIIERVLHTGK